MRAFKYWLLYNVLCPLVYAFLVLYKHLTGCRCESRQNDLEFQGKGQAIYVLFHSHLLYAIMIYMETWRYGLVGTVELSPSRDGEIMARMARLLGLRVVRGSARRQRMASIRSLLREIEAGWSLCVALDGPKGPRGHVSHSILNLARTTGLPLIPYYGRSRSEWRLPTWDRFRIPKPFSGARVYYGAPIYIPPDATDADLEAIADRLRREAGEFD